ncbi:NADH pyrophosphatase [Thoreauomyces humboldtii]|nr:NADH pyrophosphatase [Thoreauomyces humboldtii]
MSRFTHLFAGGTLNRFSVLRSNPKFISASTSSPTTRFIALRNLDPLLTAQKSVAWLSSAQVQEALAAGAFKVFLGIDEGDAAGDEFASERKGGVVVIKGRSYWAVDLSEGSVDSNLLQKLDKSFEDRQLTFAPLRGALGSLPWEIESAIVAHARSLVDWNVRNQFCPACGKQTESGESGYKRFCPRPSEDEKIKCLSTSGVNNFQHPRTDPVVIIAVIHPTDPDKILLGRQARFPAGTYTCVAGFMEPGETLEEACRREVYEETGVTVGNVAYHSSQPWPFPSSIMIGCIGRATTTDIDLVDEELEDAKWFTRAQAEAAVRLHLVPAGEGGRTDFRVPPPYAIAHQLIKAWTQGWTADGAPLGAGRDAKM